MDSIEERIETLIELDCTSTNAFAHKIGVDPRNLGKMLSGNQSITDRTLRKIVGTIGCAFEWLKYGEGEMFPNGGKQSPATINSHNENTSINDSDTINRLLAQLEEKDAQIARLLGIIEQMREKDKQIQALLELLKK